MSRPLPASKGNPDMCAIGDRIKFTCILAGKGEVTAPLISSPGGTVIITGLVIEALVDIEQNMTSGGYYCSFSTICKRTNKQDYSWRCLVIQALIIAAACINACEMNGYFNNTFQIHIL